MNSSQATYSKLIKPRWAPPAWLFGPVWSFLYGIIAASYGYIIYLFFARHLSFIIVVLPFILNLFFNVIFTWFQFKLKSNTLAMIDIFLVLGTLIWAMIAIYPYVPWITFINIPYLAWTCFATILQVTITIINFKK